jgi:hypothetical protein
MNTKLFKSIAVLIGFATAPILLGVTAADAKTVTTPIPEDGTDSRILAASTSSQTYPSPSKPLVPSPVAEG